MESDTCVADADPQHALRELHNELSTILDMPWSTGLASQKNPAILTPEIALFLNVSLPRSTHIILTRTYDTALLTRQINTLLQHIIEVIKRIFLQIT